MAIDEKAAEKRLLALKSELESQSEMSADDRAPVELDQQSVGRLSRMDAMQQQAMAEAQERSRTARLVAIDQALRRLEEGEYGYCLKCGEEIAEKRLDVDPAAAYCVNCAGAR